MSDYIDFFPGFLLGNFYPELFKNGLSSEFFSRYFTKLPTELQTTLQATIYTTRVGL